MLLLAEKLVSLCRCMLISQEKLVLPYDSVSFIHLKIQINFTSRIFFHIDAQIIVIIFI